MSKQINEVMPESLNVFTEKPYLLSIEDNELIELSPVNSLSGASAIEFFSPSFPDKFKDLNHVYLKLKIQTVKGDQTSYDATNGIQPKLACNLLHSLFRSLYVALNGTNLRAVEGNYHYKEFLETTFAFDEDFATGLLSSQMYMPNSDDNSTLSATLNSKITDVYGRLSLMQSHKLLIPGVSISIRLNMEDPNFFFIESTAPTVAGTGDAQGTFTGGTGNTSILKLLDAKLYVRHVTPKEAVTLGIERTLLTKNAVYEFRRGEIRTQNVSSGVSSISIPQLYQGPRPSLVALGILDHRSLSARDRDPFTFAHFNMTNYAWILNGSYKPANGYELKISDNEDTFNQVYSRIYEVLGHQSEGRTCLINRKNFRVNRFLLLEDCSSLGLGLDIKEPTENCTIGFKATFSTPLPDNVTVMLYLSLDSRVEISSTRVVEVF